jgi:hypothetical protein
VASAETRENELRGIGGKQEVELGFLNRFQNIYENATDSILQITFKFFIKVENL